MNPLPTKLQIKLKPMYTFANASTGGEAELQLEGLVPYAGLVLPGPDLVGFWSIARAQLTGARLETGSGTVGGLEDMTFVDVVAHELGPVRLGGGFGSVLPIATSSELGGGKWLLGPALAIRFNPVSALRLSALTQALWSVAGSSQSPDVGYVSLQPFLKADLPASLFVSSDATMKFFWTGGSTTVPINIGLGRAFGEHLVVIIKGQVAVAGIEQGTAKSEVDLILEP